MNAVGFLKNFTLAGQALQQYNFTTSDARFKVVLELALKMEEIELQNREMALKEEQMRQELELKALESKNKYENASVELIKNLVQAKSMIKSVWDNANINKCNALVGLFNVVMNAQNAANLDNWKAHFEEIKNSIFAIGQDTDLKGNKNELVDDFNPLIDTAFKILNELNFANANLKQVGILAPKYEILVDEPVLLKGFSIYSKESGFIIDGETFKQSNFLFKKEKAGEYEVRYYTLNDKNEKVEEKAVLKVLDKKFDNID